MQNTRAAKPLRKIGWKARSNGYMGWIAQIGNHGVKNGLDSPICVSTCRSTWGGLSGVVGGEHECCSVDGSSKEPWPATGGSLASRRSTTTEGTTRYKPGSWGTSSRTGWTASSTGWTASDSLHQRQKLQFQHRLDSLHQRQKQQFQHRLDSLHQRQRQQFQHRLDSLHQQLQARQQLLRLHKLKVDKVVVCGPKTGAIGARTRTGKLGRTRPGRKLSSRRWKRWAGKPGMTLKGWMSTWAQ